MLFCRTLETTYPFYRCKLPEKNRQETYSEDTMKPEEHRASPIANSLLYRKRYKSHLFPYRLCPYMLKEESMHKRIKCFFFIIIILVLVVFYFSSYQETYREKLPSSLYSYFILSFETLSAPDYRLLSDFSISVYPNQTKVYFPSTKNRLCWDSATIQNNLYIPF